MHLLLVEDDLELAQSVINGFRDQHDDVDHAADGASGLRMAAGGQYQVVILDRMLPLLDGLSIVKRLRSQSIMTPVIYLTTMSGIDDRVDGLEAGGDDYLIKPFAFAELLARVQALVRRASAVVEPARLVFGELSVDLLKREVVRSGRQIDLQRREFALLEYLMRNATRVVSKTMILEHLWGYTFDPQTNVVDVLVCRLRKQLEVGATEKLIHTVRGAGYVLRAP